MTKKEKLCGKLDDSWQAFAESDHDWYAGDVIKTMLTISKDHMSSDGLKKLIEVFNLET